MTRLLGMFGFTGGFLVISPAMRHTILDVAAVVGTFVENHSPYSYIGVAVLVFGGVTLTLLSGSRVVR